MQPHGNKGAEVVNRRVKRWIIGLELNREETEIGRELMA